MDIISLQEDGTDRVSTAAWKRSFYMNIALCLYWVCVWKTLFWPCKFAQRWILLMIIINWLFLFMPSLVYVALFKFSKGYCGGHKSPHKKVDQGLFCALFGWSLCCCFPDLPVFFIRYATHLVWYLPCQLCYPSMILFSAMPYLTFQLFLFFGCRFWLIWQT